MRKFYVVVTRWSSMLWSGWIILIIMISAMALTHISVEGKSVRKLRTFLSSFEGNSIRYSKNRNGKETDHRGKTHKNLDMEPLILKLDTALNRYEFKRGEVKEIYSLVEPCMPDKCGKSQRWNYKIPNSAKFKGCKKKKILGILSEFRLGIQSFFWSFQDLISLLDGRRMEILCEFKNDFKMLKLEVESLLPKKRLKAAGNRVMATLPSPSTGDRLVNELMIIQDSKDFLNDWKKTLSKAFACWSKRKTH